MCYILITLFKLFLTLHFISEICIPGIFDEYRAKQKRKKNLLNLIKLKTCILLNNLNG